MTYFCRFLSPPETAVLRRTLAETVATVSGQDVSGIGFLLDKETTDILFRMDVQIPAGVPLLTGALPPTPRADDDSAEAHGWRSRFHATMASYSCADVDRMLGREG